MEELREFLSACEFGSPLHFWIGSVFAFLLLFFPLWKKRRGLALDLGTWQRRVDLRSRWRSVLPALVAVTTLLMAAVLANPRVATKQSVSLYGKPVMIVIDISGSMEYRGFRGTERFSPLEKARLVFDDLLRRDIKADFGLLLYSTETYIARYFALRQELLADTLENDEEVRFIATGTRTAEALAKARTFLLEKVDAKEKAIVLISDLEADPEAVLQMAEEMGRDILAGIQVYVIVAKVDRRRTLDAQASQPPIEGVRMVQMDDEQGIDQVCAEIAAMESSPVRQEESLVKRSLVPFLIPPTLGLISLCLALSETCLRKLP